MLSPRLLILCPLKVKENVLVTQLCLILCNPMTIACQVLFCPWNSLGKNTGVNSHSPFRGFSLTQDWTQISHIAFRFFTIGDTRKACSLLILWATLKETVLSPFCSWGSERISDLPMTPLEVKSKFLSIFEPKLILQAPPQELQETWVQSLGGEDPLEEGMATPSSILAWRIPRAEESGGLQSTGLQRVPHNWSSWATRTLLTTVPLFQWSRHQQKQPHLEPCSDCKFSLSTLFFLF